MLSAYNLTLAMTGGFDTLQVPGLKLLAVLLSLWALAAALQHDFPAMRRTWAQSFSKLLAAPTPTVQMSKSIRIPQHPLYWPVAGAYAFVVVLCCLPLPTHAQHIVLNAALALMVSIVLVYLGYQVRDSQVRALVQGIEQRLAECDFDRRAGLKPQLATLREIQEAAARHGLTLLPIDCEMPGQFASQNYAAEFASPGDYSDWAAAALRARRNGKHANSRHHISDRIHADRHALGVGSTTGYWHSDDGGE